LLIADIAMPDVDGYELIARVRQSCERVPAVAVSAYARPEDRRRALAAGYDGYCCKPIETGTFLRTVREVLIQYEQPFLKPVDRLIGRQGFELA
jgi:CheY-like chemotaxis protein